MNSDYHFNMPILSFYFVIFPERLAKAGAYKMTNRKDHQSFDFFRCTYGIHQNVFCMSEGDVVVDLILVPVCADVHNHCMTTSAFACF